MDSSPPTKSMLSPVTSYTLYSVTGSQIVGSAVTSHVLTSPTSKLNVAAWAAEMYKQVNAVKSLSFMFIPRN